MPRSANVAQNGCITVSVPILVAAALYDAAATNCEMMSLHYLKPAVFPTQFHPTSPADFRAAIASRRSP